MHMGFFKNISNGFAKIKEGNKTASLLLAAAKAVEKSDFVNAIKLYTELIDLGAENDKKLSQYYEARANVYKMMEDIENALQDLDTAIELNPLNDFALAKRAFILSLNGKDEKALADINEALRINPENSIAKMLLENKS